MFLLSVQVIVGTKGVNSWAAALMQTTERCHALEALHRLHCIKRKMMR